jgi:succinoglycan biosynthesis transport protein ExoP
VEEALEKNRFLYDVLYVVFRRKVRLALLFGFSFGLVVFFASLTTPTFKATTKILVRPNPQQQLILFKNLATPGKENPSVNPSRNLIQILTGKQMAREVVEKFGLGERAERKANESKSQIVEWVFDILNAIVSTVQRMIGIESHPHDYVSEAVKQFIEKAEDVQLEEESDVINLTIWEETPELSSDIANFMAHRLLERAIELEQENAREAYRFISDKITQAETELRNAEETLFAFRKQHGVINFTDQKQERLKNLTGVEDRFRILEVQIGENEAKLEEMHKRIEAQKKLLADAPVFSNNPVVKELVNAWNIQEIKLAGALERFTGSSEDVKTLKAQAAESKDRIEKQLAALLNSETAVLQSIHPNLASEYTDLVVETGGLRAKRAILESQISGLREEAFELAELEMELKNLNTRRAAKTTIYESLLGKFSQLEVQKVFDMIGAYDLKVVDKAYIPEDARPDRPEWSLLLPLGLVGSFLLSLGLVFFIEYWDESFKSPQDIEQKLDLDVLCTVPDMSK